MYAVRIVILVKIRQLSLQVTGIPEERLVKKFPTNGFDDSLDEEIQAKYIELSPYNRQHRLHRLIQQINRLLEPLVPDEGGIRSFSGLYGRMPEQMLNISDRGTSIQWR